MRWGLGDFFWVYLTGFVAAFVGASIGYGISGDKAGHAGALTIGLALVGQFGGWVVGLVWVSRRKGRGSLRADFGLVVHPRDLWAVPAGIGLEIALALMVFPISNLVQNQRQGVVNDLESAHGLHLAVLALFAGVIAPVCEELLFRGLLLRALRRRFSPVVAVAVSALVFALAHPALDPSWGTFVIVPALFGMGALSGAVAVRRGDLSVSILLHIGFNFLTTFGAVVDSLHHH
ncbi:MAG: protease family protein [Actinomycetota bacterium]|nr:protease family protein [Actinomycetota bacterium]